MNAADDCAPPLRSGPATAERESAWARAWTVLAVVLVLGTLNLVWSGKAWIIEHGREVLVPLAPIDPRALMEGDYMALRFPLAEQIEQARAQGAAPTDPAGATHEGASGRAPVKLDPRGVVELDWATSQPELALRYRLRQGGVWLGTNAFFFEEGKAERYSAARFGVFRVDPDSGEAVLVALADEAGKRL